MYKRICFIYTETTGLHQTTENVSKKKLFEFARMVSLNYEIGTIKNNEFVQEIKTRKIVKPRSMVIPEQTIKFHGITQVIANQIGTDPEDIINQFKTEIKNVDIIVSHNVDFHLKTILAEAVRYNINLDLSGFVIVDTISFYHNYEYIKLKDLGTKLSIKNISESNENNVELIKNIFLKLYVKFKKSLNSKDLVV